MQAVTLAICSRTDDDTRKIGHCIGTHIPDGSLITLSGPLGSGKTTLVQGIATGLEVPEDFYITSPTYTIMHEYPGRSALYHIDLYRLWDEEDLYDTGIEEILDGSGIKVVEWPEKIAEPFSRPDLAISLTPAGEKIRNISINVYRRDFSNLLKALKSLCKTP